VAPRGGIGIAGVWRLARSPRSDSTTSGRWSSPSRIFWKYLFWSQHLLIWYGNVPEETFFVEARLGSQFLQDIWYLEGFWQRLGEPRSADA
jgi:hypothetical protein